MSVHFAARCPTIRCDWCGKLGRINQIYKTIRPWDCIAALCAFQSPGQGLFYFPYVTAGKASKEHDSSVISVLEGYPDFKHIENEFNQYFGSSWRCTARVMRPNHSYQRTGSSGSRNGIGERGSPC
jgi:hypothetical protein